MRRIFSLFELRLLNFFTLIFPAYNPFSFILKSRLNGGEWVKGGYSHKVFSVEYEIEKNIK